MKTLSSEKENLLKSHICDLYESKCFLVKKDSIMFMDFL